MFADIEGFTAWSSVREPSQVFTLLETLYAAMDATATRRRVFKVETVGDCYVAVCGLPEPKADHAVTMARFARDCIEQHISIVTGKLERALGPETGELRLRVGIHSGKLPDRRDKSRLATFPFNSPTLYLIQSRPDHCRCFERKRFKISTLW